MPTEYYEDSSPVIYVHHKAEGLHSSSSQSCMPYHPSMVLFHETPKIGAQDQSLAQDLFTTVCHAALRTGTSLADKRSARRHKLAMASLLPMCIDS